MSNEYGAIPLSTANAVGASLKKKMGSLTGFAPVDWAETINKLGNKLPERTVSGAVCSFSDGADDVPMPSVKASITAVQAGSGDPSPSNVRAISGFAECDVTHTKKNLFNEATLTLDNTLVTSTGGTQSNSAYKSTDYILMKAGTYTMSGVGVDDNTTANIRFRLVSYDMTPSKTFIAMDVNSYGAIAVGTNYSVSFTLASDCYIRISSRKNLIEKLMIEVGSTATDYESYAGETIPVWMGGKNLFDKDSTPFVAGKYISGGSVGGTPTYQNNQNYSIFSVLINPNTTYTFGLIKANDPRWCTIDEDGNITRIATNQGGSEGTSVTFTSQANDRYLLMSVAIAGTYKCDDILQVEVGSTATTFEPVRYIYGGELNLTTGVLTVTHDYIASYNGETINEPWISSIDKYVAGNSPSTGAQVVYPLTTPTTIQLTAEEVRSFLGTNNLWANTGDSEVTYFAQPSGGITPVFTEEVICDNSSASSTLTFTEDWHDYDLLQFKLTNSSSGIITYITTTPDILDEIFAKSSNKVLFNEFSNDQYALYTKSSDLSWSRSGTRNVNVTEVKGLTATNCTVSTEWIYKRGAITASNVTITAPKYFEAYDEIYMASCDGDSDDTMPCILPVRAGCAGYNFYGNNGRNCVRLTGNTAADTYGKDETKNIFAMMGINYEEV